MKKETNTGWSILSWLNENSLVLLGAFLLAFIPLYPKIPLFSPIEQYIVRVRLEDMFILLAAVIWAIKFISRKIKVNALMFWGVLAYAFVGFLSVISAVFLIKTVPLQPLHLGKTLLHYFRYLEYFSLFFISFSAIKTKKQLKIFLAVIVLTVVAVTAYGFGQKYYYWPVYSTMNREFSKGVRLYLTDHARVQSTFAGHYDLGAYLVIALPIILALGLATKNTRIKVGAYLTEWIGIWLLVVSASRSSFFAYVVGVSLVVLLFALKKPKWSEKIRWFLIRYFVLSIVILQTFSLFGEDIYERFLQIIDANPKWHEEYHIWNERRKEFIAGNFTSFLPKAEKPKNGISTDEAEIILQSDTQPTTEKPQKPADVYVDVPDRVLVSTTSAEGTVTTQIVEKDRTFSDNAIKYGLSYAIRIDTLWPQAIAGLERNPVVGSGYATLNKQNPYQFTEADSTDNNYLRVLGETGLLGFITFYGLVGILMYFAIRLSSSKDSLVRAINIGFIGSIIGLLINATYIDVFAASKVALTFWSFGGLLVASSKFAPESLLPKRFTTELSFMNHGKKNNS